MWRWRHTLVRAQFTARRNLGPLPATRGSELPLARHHVGPQRLELLRLEEIAPGRHLVLAARDRVDEALVLVGRKFPQVEGGTGILHSRAVAGRAVDRVQIGTGRDLLLREARGLLGR